MCDKNSNQTINHEELFIYAESLVNILQILSMLEKTLNRAVRRNCYTSRQYPEIFFQIEITINSLRAWIQNYYVFCLVTIFNMLLEVYIKAIEHAIEQLTANTTPLPGKSFSPLPDISL